MCTCHILCYIITHHTHRRYDSSIAIDLDKTCSEENEILNEAAACCPSCSDQVEAIRLCRCPSSEEQETNPSPSPPPTTESSENNQEDNTDNQDDPTSQLPLCEDELSAVDTCYATNIGECDNNCDAYDSDTDKTCSEEEGVRNNFVNCCDVCSTEAVEVYECRCGSSGSTTKGSTEPNDAGMVSVSHKIFVATVAVFIGSSMTF